MPTEPTIPPGADRVVLTLDHSGAVALLTALEADSISGSELDALLQLPAVSATVANTMKYLPDHTEDAFRTALRTWVASRQEPWGHFCLEVAAEHAEEARGLIAEMDSDPELVDEVLAPLQRYRPATGPLEVRVYSVVGGVSDGFVLDGQEDPAFFMAVDRAQGDAQGVKLNMTHELYHSMQEAARSRTPGLADRLSPDNATPVTRLLTTVLDEGTATWVARSMLEGDGPYLGMWRSAYEKNAGAEKITQNFAVLDRLVAALADGTMSWDEAYDAGFSGIGPPLYFAGFEMARAIEAAWGPDRVGTYFSGHPQAYFTDFLSVAPDALAPRTAEVVAGSDVTG